MKQYLLLTLLLTSFLCFAQDGTLDASFGSSGVAKTFLTSTGATSNTLSDITKIIVQPDGKILQAGHKASSTGDDFILIRYNQNGTLDLPFGTEGGWTATSFSSLSNGNDRAHSVALQSDGKIVVAGEVIIGGKTMVGMSRYTSNGLLDLTFGTNGLVTSDLGTITSGAFTIEIQPDNKILIGGYASNGNNDMLLARYNANGTIDASFGTGGKTTVDFGGGPDVITDLVILADGRILAGGTARVGTDVFALAMFTSTGMLDPAFNGTGKRNGTFLGQGRGIDISFDNKIYISGPTNNADFTTSSYNLDGSVNTTFAGGTVRTNISANNENARSVLVQCDGKVLVGGDVTGMGYVVARYLPNGTPDVTFDGDGRNSHYTGTGGADLAYSGLALQPGKILLGGISFNNSLFNPKFYPTVVRFNNPSTVPVLTVTPQSACAPGTVNLTAPAVTAGSASGLVYTYWQDTLATVPLSNPSAVSVSGTYYIKGSNGNCFTIKPVAVTISAAPSGSITPAQSSICPGGAQLLTASGGNTYQWFKDGNLITGATGATYNAVAAGTYSVQLSNGSCTAMASNTATVIMSAPPSGTITPANATICAGSNQVLTATGGSSYQWNLNGTPISGATASTYSASQAGTYSVTIFNNGCSAPASNTSTITVTPTVTPTIQISANPSGSVTTGTPITFTATITNGGAAPVYQWFVNGMAVGSNAATFTSSTLQDGDMVTATLTSNAPCAAPSTVTGNAITIDVQTVTPTVTIAMSPAGPVCSGTAINFTATATNGGNAPVFQWKVNGLNAGTNASTFTSSTLNNGDSVYVLLTSNAAGASPATVTSNKIAVVIMPAVTPTVSITANPSSGICPGTSVNFTATTTNGGSTPVYQWRKNGLPVGTNSASYTDNGLSNGDDITVAVTSNATCAQPATVTSAPFNVTVNSLPSGSISPATSSICPGGTQVLTAPAGYNYQWFLGGSMIPGATTSTYTAATAGNYTVRLDNGSCNAMASNTAVVSLAAAPSGTITPANSTICSGATQILTATGGSTYQWYRDNVLIPGATSATYTASAGGTYSVFLFNGSCNGPASNTATITVTPSVTPSIQITANPSGAIMPGTAVTFTASTSNGGSAPVYQWFINGMPAGGNSSGFTTTTLQHGDVVTASLTSNASCATPATVNSNAVTISIQTVTPAVTIMMSPTGAVCAGTAISFSATATNGGTAPAYQWKVNGANAGTNSSNFSSATLSNGDSVYVVMTSNAPGASPATVTSNKIAIVINPAVTPTVTLSANPASSICPGTPVTFTATATNGGAAPVYEWKKNGVVTGTNSTTYTDNTLNNGDVITVTLTSNAACAQPGTVTSNTYTASVSALPSGSISPATSAICAGGAQTLTATAGFTYQWFLDGTSIPGAVNNTYNATAPGNYSVRLANGNCNAMSSNTAVVSLTPTPSGNIFPATATICAGNVQTLTANGGTGYQWYLNNVLITGATNATYAATQSGTYSVVLFNGTCSGPANNTATVNVTPQVTPAIQISASPSGSISPGTAVTFTATITNGGTAPAYQWKVNGIAVGTNAATFSSNALQHGDVVTATLTSNAPCVTNAEATSNAISISIQTVAPAVSITANPSGPVCPGTTINFTAIPVNGGSTPAYQWKRNGVNVGTNNASYSSSSLSDGDTVYVIMTSSDPSANPASGTSNKLVISVRPVAVPAISISASANTICAGTPVTFTAQATNGGANPVFQWRKNGLPVGTNTDSYTDNSISNGDSYTVTLTSNAVCADPPTGTSAPTSIAVTPLPQGNISPATGSICPGGSITLTAPAGYNYQWLLDNVLIPGAVSATYLASTPGIYSVRLTSGTCTAMAANAVTVTVSAAPGGSISPLNASVCSGTAQIFTASGGTAYQWFRDGVPLPGATNASFSATQAGNYTVLITNGACTGTSPDTATLTVTPLVTPSITITATPSGTIMPGTSVTFNATTSNGGTAPSIQWQVNGINAGAPGATFTSSTLQQGDVVTAILTSNAPCVSAPTAQSNAITINTQTVTPGVSVTANPQGAVCAGTAITFTANAFNEGSAPVYQWKLNGSNVGNNAPVFSSTSLADGDTVYVVMTSNAPGVSPATVSSNRVGVSILPAVTPTVSISFSPASVCAGTPVTFTAQATGGGTAPVYQWRKNGVAVGGNSGTYTDSQLQDNDTITVTLTSNAACAQPATVSSSPAIMDVTATPSGAITPATATICPGGSQVLNAPAGYSYQWFLDGTAITGATGNTYNAAVPGQYTVQLVSGSCSVMAANTSTVTLAAAPSGVITPSTATICTGSTQILTATGGTTYQWSRNNLPIAGASAATYLATDSGTYSVMIYNGSCSGPASNTAIISLAPLVTPAIQVAASPSGTITAGTLVTFTTTVTHGGNNPVYQWKVNGIPVGTNAATFSSNALQHGDVVTVTLTSNAPCVTNAEATSNAISISIQTVSPAVSVGANPNSPVCAGTTVTFTANAQNGGSSPTYQWKLNGANVGTNSVSYSSSGLNNGDSVYVVMTSSDPGANPASVTSNRLVIEVRPNVVPAVSVTASSHTICAGTPVTFSAQVTNGGTAPVFEWRKNGQVVGMNSATYTDNTFTATDSISVSVASNAACAQPALVTSQRLGITVTALPSGAITPSAATICPGGTTNLTAPAGYAYQWFLNNVSIPGAVNAIHAAAAPGTYSVELRNGTCIAMASNTAAVSVSAAPTGTISPLNASICSGNSQVFRATGGTGYQWFHNGVAIAGATLDSLNAMQAGRYTVVITNGGCPGPVQDTATLVVTSLVTPSIQITQSPAGTITPGTPVTFTANITNGGTAPVIQWQVNGVNTGTNAASFTSATLQQGDVVTAVLTSNAPCVTATFAVSNAVTINTQTVSAGVSIISNQQSPVCSGTPITFTATPFNEGTAPVYQWKVNGMNAGVNAPSYTSSSLSDGDTVYVVMTSNAPGVTPPTVTSNRIIAAISPAVTPAVAVSGSETTICTGTGVTFTAAATNGGTSPVFQWRKNSQPVGNNSNTYTDNTLAHNDTVTVILTSNAACAQPQAVTAAPVIMDVTATPSGSISPATATICPGGSQQLTAPPGYAYQWLLNATPITGATANTYIATAAGNYSVELSSGNCTALASNTAVVTVSTAPYGTITPAAATICAGDTAVFTATGGTAYQWFRDGNILPGATGSTIRATLPGTYTVQIINGTCSGAAANSSSLTITTAPSGNISPATGSICAGDSILLTATGGTTYQWFRDGNIITGAAGNTFSAVAGGTYSVLIYNGNCSATAGNTATILVSPAPSGNITPVNAAICFGTAQTFTASGGTNYQWYRDGVLLTGVNTPTYSTGIPGSYTVRISDGNCTAWSADTASLTVTPLPQGSITPLNATICSGGSQLLTASGGSVYQWFFNNMPVAGATGPTYNATQAGSYTVHITNGSCTAPSGDTARIVTGTAPSGNISPATGSLCAGDTLLLTASGGTAYQWFRDGISIPGATGNTLQVTTPGNYTATIFNGSCSGPASNAVVLSTGTAPSGTIAPATATICTGTSQPLTASGATSYQWYKNNILIPGATGAVFQATEAGTYSVMLFNGNCSGMAANTSVVNEAAVVPAIGITASPSGSVAPNTTITFNATITNGGTAPLIQWFRNGSVVGANSTSYSANNFANGDVITAQLTSNATCAQPATVTSNSITVSITATTSPSVTISSNITGPVCNGTPVTFTAAPVNGGAAPVYQWRVNGMPAGATGSTFTVNNLADGDSISVHMTSSDPNASPATVTGNSIVVQVITVTGAISPATSVACAGDTVVLGATGGTSYQWFADGIAISGAVNANYNATAPGNYSVSVTRNGCNAMASNTASVTMHPKPAGSISPATGVLCPGGQIQLQASSSVAYQWYRNNSPIAGAVQSTLMVTAPGSYSVILSNGQCSSPASNNAVISSGTVPVATIAPSVASVCAGDAQLLSTSGGDSYQWYRDNILLPGATGSSYSATTGGVYSVQVFNGSCNAFASNTASITIIPAPSGSISPASVTICSGASTELSATGGQTYQWMHDGVSIPGTNTSQLRVQAAGNYTVRIFNGNCSAPASNAAIVTVNTPTGTISPAAATICPGGSRRLTATGGTAYEWSLDGVLIPGANGSGIDASLPGVYSVVIISNGCRGAATNTATITRGTVPAGRITPSIDSICAGEIKQLQASGGTTYQWYLDGVSIQGATGSAYAVTLPGQYSVEVSNGSCQAMSPPAIIKARAIPKGVRYADVAIARNRPFLLQARAIGQEYVWSPAQGLSDPTIPTPYVTTASDRVYTVRIKQPLACAVTDTLRVRVFDAAEIYVPDAFTPDNNGLNDLLRPTAVHIKTIKYFRVINRWGEIVFETTRAGQGWDGTFRGRPQPTGTYIWLFEGVDTDGRVVQAKGTSTLIR